MKWFERERMLIAKGHTAGQLMEFQNTVSKLLSKGMTESEIAQLLDRDVEEVKAVTSE